jgi:hypothetical protein
MNALPFDDWLDSEVGPMLIAHGYRGTRRRFTRSTEAGSLIDHGCHDLVALGRPPSYLAWVWRTEVGEDVE